MASLDGNGGTGSVQQPLLAEAPVATRQTEKDVRSRLVSLDLFRGLIIMIMAWDHVTHQFTSARDSPSGFRSEFWEFPYANYDNAPRKYLARNVSHICAPGFFFTMGISMVLFTSSRIEKLNWSWSRVFMHHFLRGCVLLLIEYAIDFPGGFPRLVDVLRGREVSDWSKHEYHKGDEGVILYHSLLAIFEVMTALGLVMMIAQLFMPVLFRVESYKHAWVEWAGWGLFFVFFAISDIAIVNAQGDVDLSNPPVEYPHFPAKVENFGQFLGRVFLFPGKLFADWNFILYPVIPWIAIACLGMGFGFTFRRDAKKAHDRLLLFAPVLLVAFVIVRAAGGVLNYRGQQRGEESEASPFMQFFIQTKYPPDLPYAFITLGVIFLLIKLFSHDVFLSVDEDSSPQPQNGDVESQQQSSRSQYLICSWKERGWRHPFYPLLVFGRTPLCFYICHMWFISLFEAMFRIPEPPSGKFPLQGVLFVWMFVLFAMYHICKRYLAFKSSTHPASLWRMF